MNLFRPTEEQRRQVEALVGFGLRDAEVCLLIINPETERPIDEGTLRLRFPDELATGAIKANTRVARSMYEMATSSENTSTRLGAASFWLARRAKWKETTISENVGKDGGPIEVSVSNARHRISTAIDQLHRKLGSGEAGSTPEEEAGSDPKGFDGC